jgi:hypothetical protein
LQRSVFGNDSDSDFHVMIGLSCRALEGFDPLPKAAAGELLPGGQLG